MQLLEEFLLREYLFLLHLYGSSYKEIDYRLRALEDAWYILVESEEKTHA